MPFIVYDAYVSPPGWGGGYGNRVSITTWINCPTEREAQDTLLQLAQAYWVYPDQKWRRKQTRRTLRLSVRQQCSGDKEPRLYRRILRVREVAERPQGVAPRSGRKRRK